MEIILTCLSGKDKVHKMAHFSCVTLYWDLRMREASLAPVVDPSMGDVTDHEGSTSSIVFLVLAKVFDVFNSTL